MLNVEGAARPLSTRPGARREATPSPPAAPGASGMRSLPPPRSPAPPRRASCEHFAGDAQLPPSALHAPGRGTRGPPHSCPDPPSPLGALPAKLLVRTVPSAPSPDGLPSPRLQSCSLQGRLLPPLSTPRQRGGPGAIAGGAPRLPGPSAARCERRQMQSGASWPGWGFYSRHILAVHGRPAPPPPAPPSPAPAASTRVGVTHIPRSVRSPAGDASPWNVTRAAPVGAAPRPRPCRLMKRRRGFLEA